MALSVDSNQLERATSNAGPAEMERRLHPDEQGPDLDAGRVRTTKRRILKWES